LKVGTENRKKLAVMVALLLLAVFLLFRMLNTPGPAAATISPGAPRRPSPEQRRTQLARGAQLTSTLDPTLRLDLLKTSEETAYKGTSRNIFKPQPDEPPKPLPNPVVNPGPIFGPPPPPAPPPINLKFFGFANKPGEPKRVFLSQGEDVFIAGEGEIVNRRYRVVRIGPTSVEIEDVLTNHSERIPLTQG
jgi:hypothetical protein